jgi:hypothetical protein
MGTQQSETRLAVVKTESRDPGLHPMARFTLLLLRGEFVRIAVTRDARTLLENVLVRRARAALLMAVRTCHSHMGSGQIKPGLAMPDKRECRRSEAINVMAGLTLVFIPRNKLTVMSILMTIRAGFRLRMVIREGSLFLVTVDAGHLCVLSHQGVFRREMSLHIEG